MPYSSRAQHRLFRALEAQGKLPAGTASRWAHETLNLKQLPEHKHRCDEDECDKEASTALPQNAYAGRLRALATGGANRNPFGRAQQNNLIGLPGGPKIAPALQVPGLKPLTQMPIKQAGFFSDSYNAAFGKDPMSRLNSWQAIQGKMPGFVRNHVNNKVVAPQVQGYMSQLSNAIMGPSDGMTWRERLSSLAGPNGLNTATSLLGTGLLAGAGVGAYHLYKGLKQPPRQPGQLTPRQFNVGNAPVRSVNSNLGLDDTGRSFSKMATGLSLDEYRELAREKLAAKTASMFGKPFLSALGKVISKAGPVAASLTATRERRGLGPAMTGPGVGKAYRDLAGKKGYKLTPDQRKLVIGHLREMTNYRGGDMSDADVRRNAGRGLINLQTSMREMHKEPGRYRVQDTRNPLTFFSGESPRVQTSTPHWLDRRYEANKASRRVDSQDAVYGHKPTGKEYTLGGLIDRHGNNGLARGVLKGYPLGGDGSIIGPAYGVASHVMKNVGDIKKPTNIAYFSPSLNVANAYLANGVGGPPGGIPQRNNTFLSVFSPAAIKAEKPLISTLARERIRGGYLNEMHGGQPVGSRFLGMYKPLSKGDDASNKVFAEFVPAGFSADRVVNKALRRAGLASLAKSPSPPPIKHHESFQPTYDIAKGYGISPSVMNKIMTNPKALSLFTALKDAPLETQRKQLSSFVKENARRQGSPRNMATNVAQISGREKPSLWDYLMTLGASGRHTRSAVSDIKEKTTAWSPQALAEVLARYGH